MLYRLGSSIGSSYRSFEGYFDTLKTLEGILTEKSNRAIAKHPDDIRAMRESIIDRKIDAAFGNFLSQSNAAVYKRSGHDSAWKKPISNFANPLSPLIKLAKRLVLPLAIAASKVWMRMKISDRSVEKILIKQDIEHVFEKFSATLAEKLNSPDQLIHQKLSLPDLLDIQGAFKLKENFDRSTTGDLDNSTKKALANLSHAFEGQSDSNFYKGVDADTAALIRNISHEILETAHSDRIPAYWGDTDSDRVNNH